MWVTTMPDDTTALPNYALTYVAGEQGFAEMGYHTVEVGVGVATWAIRRGWSMTHWRESANLMWRNLEHVTGAYSEHAKAELYTQLREGRRTPRRRDAPRERH